MKQRTQFITKGAALMLLAVIFQGFSTNRGGDYYRIFLNDKLVAEQFLTQPKSPGTLSLNTANANDQLFVHFSHCGVAGRERTITLTNEKGSPVKVWRYADTKSTAMQLPVKELLNAAGKIGAGAVYYASKEKPAGLLLTRLELKKPVMAKP